MDDIKEAVQLIALIIGSVVAILTGIEKVLSILIKIKQLNRKQNLREAGEKSPSPFPNIIPYKENENKNIISCILGMRCHRMVGQ